MKSIVAVLLFAISLQLNAMSLTKKNISTCDIKFTQEQQYILDMVYDIGYPHGLGRVMQGIVIQESFLWKSVKRTRSVTPYDESFGIMQIRPVVAVWVASVAKLYNITEEEVKILLSHKEGDVLSAHLALSLLLVHKKGGYSVDSMIARYNAGSYYKGTQGKKYLERVKGNIKYLNSCGINDL